MAVPQTIRHGKLGRHELRLVRKENTFYGLADGKSLTTGPDADRVWAQLQEECAKAGPNYFGYAGARSRFLKIFPGGFASHGYAESERTYKVDAQTRLAETAPLAQALTGTGFGERVLVAFRDTNLLSPFEKTRLQAPLRGPDADAIVQAAAAFAAEANAPTLQRLEAVLKPHGCAKWTVATYLPFLWRPGVHMFLKPEVTKDYATRVGHPFALSYEARLSFSVYKNLLDLVERTVEELADLQPRDHIDIQSFLWVVSHYHEDGATA